VIGIGGYLDEARLRQFYGSTQSELAMGGTVTIFGEKKTGSPASKPVTEQEIHDKLAADGFSNIQIKSRNFFDAVATRDGRALSLAIDPQSGKVMRAPKSSCDLARQRRCCPFGARQ
jgi:hypothetical protein